MVTLTKAPRISYQHPDRHPTHMVLVTSTPTSEPSTVEMLDKGYVVINGEWVHNTSGRRWN